MMYIILSPLNLADEDIIRCGIWKLSLEKCKFEKTYNFSTVRKINHRKNYQINAKFVMGGRLQIENI